ncbi:hypothetical protein ACJX0J_024338, partial [Zea mays]
VMLGMLCGNKNKVSASLFLLNLRVYLAMKCSWGHVGLFGDFNFRLLHKENCKANRFIELPSIVQVRFLMLVISFQFIRMEPFNSISCNIDDWDNHVPSYYPYYIKTQLVT